MAEVIPFRGVLYNPDVIENLSQVVAPPYDVISAEEQAYFYALHPKNIIRLILNRHDPGETDDSRHQRAAQYFQQWLAEGTLKQDRRPAFYLTSVDFPMGDRTVTRYGVIANVRIEPFEKRIIMPHEKTFSKVRSERLGLMKACHSNFSPIFSIFSDRQNILVRLKTSVGQRPAEMDVVNHKGLRHRLWRVTDPDTLAAVCSGFTDRRLYIADGHHRYETALAYRRWIGETQSDFDEEHPANYVMMYLASLQDPGLVILPAHRLLKSVPAAQMENALNQARAYFDITEVSTESGFEQACRRFRDTVNAGSEGPTATFGVYRREADAFHVLTVKPDVMDHLFGQEMHEATLRLDVTVLTRLMFMHLLGFDAARLDDDKLIGYRTDAVDAVDAVRTGDYDAAFIINPTRLEHVQAICDNGLIMPRKSTYFYPKVLSGRVLNLLRPDAAETDRHLALSEELLAVLGSAGFDTAKY